jgi:hypothetical protein
MRPRHGLVTAVLVAAAALAGCSESAPQRGPIRGTVTLDGRPLEAGKVRFFALTGGVSTEGEVRDGRYDVPADRGPTAGKYRVEVTFQRTTGRKVPDWDAGPGDTKDETVEVIPAKYNRDSTLQIDFDPASDKTHDFDLKTK